MPAPTANQGQGNGNKEENIIWSTLADSFFPRFQIPPINTCKIDNDVKMPLKPIDLFKKMFPPSLLIFISECTNKRLTTYEKQKKNEKF